MQTLECWGLSVKHGEKVYSKVVIFTVGFGNDNPHQQFLKWKAYTILLSTELASTPCLAYQAGTCIIQNTNFNPKSCSGWFSSLLLRPMCRTSRKLLKIIELSQSHNPTLVAMDKPRISSTGEPDQTHWTLYHNVHIALNVHIGFW